MNEKGVFLNDVGGGACAVLDNGVLLVSLSCIINDSFNIETGPQPLL